jgi:hypothetical protein
MDHENISESLLQLEIAVKSLVLSPRHSNAHTVREKIEFHMLMCNL